MKKCEKLIIKINDKEINMIINRKKIKNTYIRIDDHKQIIVNTHLKTSFDYIFELVNKHQNKILKQIENKTKNELPIGQIIYLDNIYYVTIINANDFAYKINNDTIILYTNKKNELAIEEFYRNMAIKIFSIELNKAFGYFEKNFNLIYPELVIRKMKNRYGTCYYSRNKICLNLNLIKHDLDCVNYVINHELCHFVHHDHSNNFYKLLETVVKNHKELRRRLFNL
ncbi:MAG: putative zinc metallopeptidase [Haloplasmataceae bacterium]|jgi:predicted metal-dependent hydrolase|nr:putative zinc metallopeptidase [Haloplasmataceae bacterium]